MKLKICPIDKLNKMNSLGYLSCTDYVAWLVNRPLKKRLAEDVWNLNFAQYGCLEKFQVDFY